MRRQILLGIMLATLLLVSGCGDKIDEKNEEILERLLELENMSVNEVSIIKETIFVSVEASGAGGYDTEIIAWWGTIFGLASLLQGDYQVVIIENTVNKEPYVYISTNVYTIRDFEEDRISDVEFWEETLITGKKPKTREILRASMLPKETLASERKARTGTLKTIIWILIAIIIIAVIITTIIFVSKKGGKHKEKIKRKIKEHAHKIKGKTRKKISKKKTTKKK